ncbi:hypothetical protein E1B06_16055 [Brevibacillus laterosporus]|uniref:copper amine oxidase N-terminal domain-containing protein n=1 Tax=Brevibacillus laterosporus TaxID=1465 RepID=UPI002404D7CD|nr:copper amine oxidase N-terminal domain-containing protein [Brevibacillus laterosporus]MDF9413196.1 hypothetical protein [Brevibacillus laterosporus]
MFKRSNAAKLTVCLALMWMIAIPKTVMAFKSMQYVEVKKPITVTELQPQHHVEVKINGSVINFPDAQPYIDSRSKHTMVPIRFVSEALDLGVGWESEPNQAVLLYYEEENIVALNVGANRANVDGGFFTFDAAAVIKDDRVFVPLEFFSKILGAKVEWVFKDKMVQITKGKIVGGIPVHLINN